MATLSPPVLSELDPVIAAEGSIDPLSLGRVYDHLADRILPALTVRMSRIRFVTAIAVGARVCADWEDEDLAADGVTPPWLVYEWFVVEAFVRERESLRQREGALRIPGQRKVANAIRARRPLSGSAYLKTPTVFGLTGIFRRLVEKARVVTTDLRLDDAGYELVRAWEKDQGLEGFLEAGGGEGARFRKALQSAVEQGMRKGHTVDQGHDFWREVAARLDPGAVGRAERKQLDAIVRGVGEQRLGFSRELVEAVEARGDLLTFPEETDFLRKLAPKASPGLAEALAAIDEFEAICRPISSAFDLLRHQSTGNGGVAVGPAEFAEHHDGPKLAKAVRAAVERLKQAATLLDWEPEVRDLVDRYEPVANAADLFRAVVEHHEAAQRDKPPDGKRPWLERTRDERVLVRTAYQVAEKPGSWDLYTHEYRIPTLSHFLADLGRFR
jgi:hypothetical protein